MNWLQTKTGWSAKEQVPSASARLPAEFWEFSVTTAAALGRLLYSQYCIHSLYQKQTESDRDHHSSAVLLLAWVKPSQSLVKNALQSQTHTQTQTNRRKWGQGNYKATHRHKKTPECEAQPIGGAPIKQEQAPRLLGEQLASREQRRLSETSRQYSKRN